MRQAPSSTTLIQTARRLGIFLPQFALEEKTDNPKYTVVQVTKLLWLTFCVWPHKVFIRTSTCNVRIALVCLQSILSRSLLILPVLCCLYLFVVSALTPFMTTSSLIPLSLMSCGTVQYRSSPRAKGRFAPVCGTNRCKAHLLCKLDPLSALRSGAN